MSAASPMRRKKSAAIALPLPYWLREFGLIRRAALTFIGALGLATAAVFGTAWSLGQARQDEALALQARDAARGRYVNVETEKEDIRNFQPQFVALRDRGLIGEENRIEWLDAIRQIQQQRQLLPISYEIAPQQAIKLETRMSTGQYQLRGSRMKLHMELLHEGDLFYFLNDLKERSFFAVQDCAIKRSAGGLDAPLAPTLAADCTLNWLTLKPVAAAPASLNRTE